MNAQDSPAAAEVPDTPATPPSEAARELHQPAWRGHATTHANLVLEEMCIRDRRIPRSSTWSSWASRT